MSLPSLEDLVPWALRIAGRFSSLRRMTHLGDDLGGVALLALSRAMAAHDPSQGDLKPFAKAWIVGEIRKAIQAEQDHTEPLPPLLRGEERAGELLEALLDLYVGSDLRVGEGASTEDKYLNGEASAALHRAIDRLSADEKRLIEARYWREETWRDIGAAYGISERAAQKRDEAVRRELREALYEWDRVRPIRGRS